MNRKLAKQIGDAVEKVLAESRELKALGNFRVKLKGGRIDVGAVIWKVQVAEVGEDGAVQTPEMADLKRFAQYDGLGDKIEQIFTHQGDVYRLVGYKTRAGTRPYIAERVRDGKQFVFPTASIQRLYGVKVTEMV